MTSRDGAASATGVGLVGLIWRQLQVPLTGLVPVIHAFPLVRIPPSKTWVAGNKSGHEEFWLCR